MKNGKKSAGCVVRALVSAATIAATAMGTNAHGQEPPAATPPGGTGAPAGPAPIPSTYRAPNAPAVVRRSRRSGHVRLDYQLGKGSGTCDSEVLFRKILSAELKEPDPFVLRGRPDGVVTVRLERDPPGFRGTMELADATGAILEHVEVLERTCADAADRLIIDLMVRVFPEEQPPPPPPPEEAPRCPCGDLAGGMRELRARLDAQEETIEKQGEALRDLRKALEDERKRKMDLTFALSAGALMTANLTSNVGPGVWLGGDVRTGPISLGLEARAVLPAPVFLPPGDFDVSQMVALLTPCGRYSVFFGCAVAGAGIELHYDSNFPGAIAGQTSGPVLQVGGRLGVEYFFGDSPFGARAWGEVLYSAPQTSWSYTLSDGNTVRWQRPDVSAFFGLGLVFKLGSDSSSQGAR